MDTIINTASDVGKLAQSGFTDWKSIGRVSVVEDGDLLLFNYSNEVQCESDWNTFERISRGLIVNKVSGEVTAYPFDKFWNWFEGGRGSSGHIICATEKIDGSMGTLYRDSGYKVATRGRFDSDQAIWATKFLNDNYHLDDLPNEYTLIFEIVYPENRVIADYGNTRCLYLLAIRNRFTGMFLPFFPTLIEASNRYGFPLPKVYSFNSPVDILEMTGKIDANTEGWVVEFSDGQRFKFKGDRYLELHRLVSGLSYKRAVEAVLNDNVGYVIRYIPEEFLNLFNEWVGQVHSRISEIESLVNAKFSIAPKEGRKEYALWTKANCPELSKYMFARLDGKSILPIMRSELLGS